LGGKISALTTGSAVITATLGSLTDTATVTVTAATPVSIAINASATSLANGLTISLTATATYSDGQTSDVTELASWGSSAPVIATISDAAGTKGDLSALDLGTTVITASLGSVSSTLDFEVTSATLASIRIDPDAPSQPLGLSQQFQAFGTYTDGTEIDITDDVFWTTDFSTGGQTDAIWISNSAGTQGTAYSIKEGTATVNASLDGKTDGTTMTVTAKEITQITYSPSTAITLDVGSSQQITVTGVYSDGSTIDLTDPSEAGYSTTWTPTSALYFNLHDGGTIGLIKATSEGSPGLTVDVVTPWITDSEGFAFLIRSQCVSGTRYDLYCWYLSDAGESCDDVCSTNSASYHSATMSLVGSSGTGQRCEDLLQTLDPSIPEINVSNDGITNPDTLGLGCTVLEMFNQPVRYNSPATNSSDFHADFKRACACTK
jgi:hypothetical protein